MYEVSLYFATLCKETASIRCESQLKAGKTTTNFLHFHKYLHALLLLLLLFLPRMFLEPPQPSPPPERHASQFETLC